MTARKPKESEIVEAVALALCNDMRRRLDMEPVQKLDDVHSPKQYRKQARVALAAYRKAVA